MKLHGWAITMCMSWQHAACYSRRGAFLSLKGMPASHQPVHQPPPPQQALNSYANNNNKALAVPPAHLRLMEPPQLSPAHSAQSHSPSYPPPPAPHHQMTPPRSPGATSSGGGSGGMPAPAPEQLRLSHEQVRPARPACDPINCLALLRNPR